jgi:hypothetical protein
VRHPAFRTGESRTELAQPRGIAPALPQQTGQGRHQVVPADQPERGPPQPRQRWPRSSVVDERVEAGDDLGD